MQYFTCPERLSELGIETKSIKTKIFLTLNVNFYGVGGGGCIDFKLFNFKWFQNNGEFDIYREEDLWNLKLICS